MGNRKEPRVAFCVRVKSKEAEKKLREAVKKLGGGQKLLELAIIEKGILTKDEVGRNKPTGPNAVIAECEFCDNFREPYVNHHQAAHALKMHYSEAHQKFITYQDAKAKVLGEAPDEPEPEESPAEKTPAKNGKKLFGLFK